MKNNRLVDIIIVIGILVAMVVGIITIKHFRETASKEIEYVSPIDFTVFLRGVTLTDAKNPVKKGDGTFISIRNVPYTNLKVVDTKMLPKLVSVGDISSKGYKVVPDATQTCTYDIMVTVTDTAKITKDGAVAGGNKIKIGLPITLEGQSYKLVGAVSDVKILAAKK